MEVLDELGAGGPQRDGPGAGIAVRVAGVVEDVAERDLLAGQRGQHGAKARTGSCRHDDSAARRASSGTAGPFSSGIMNPAER